MGYRHDLLDRLLVPKKISLTITISVLLERYASAGWRVRFFVLWGDAKEKYLRSYHVTVTGGWSRYREG